MIGRILALAIGLLSGLAASQGPEFAQQYRQRLGGAIEELRRVAARFDEDAQASGLTRERAIGALRGNGEDLVRRQGEAQAAIGERLLRLERQRDAFERAGPFDRLLVLIRDPDPGLVRGTYLDFRPAVPATGEGLLAGAGGFLIGWLALLFGARAAGRLTPRRLWSSGRDGRLRQAGRGPPVRRRTSAGSAAP